MVKSSRTESQFTMVSSVGNNKNQSICLISSVPSTLWAFYRGLIRQLMDRDFAVTVVFSQSLQMPEIEQQLKCTVWPVEISRQISPFRDFLSICKLAKYLRKKKPKIVHAHTPKGGLIGITASYLANIPNRIYTIHGLPLETASGLKRKLLWLAEKFTCAQATQILAVSPSLRRRVLEEALCPSNKIEVLAEGTACGIDVNLFNPTEALAITGNEIRRQLGIPNDGIVTGFVGRVVPDKGIEELVEAFEKVQSQVKNTYLLIVGVLDTVREIVSEKTQRKITENQNIIFNGKRVANTDMPNYYAAMDMLVLPSRREGYGLVLLEAAAIKLPTIATHITGCMDAVVDGNTGLLVELDNVDQLAQAILRLVQNPSMRKEFGQNGYDRVHRSFNSEKLIDCHLNLYQNLMA